MSDHYIKPCQCGLTPIVTKHQSLNSSTTGYYVKCTCGCLFEKFGLTRSEAITEWNLRMNNEVRL